MTAKVLKIVYRVRLRDAAPAEFADAQAALIHAYRALADDTAQGGGLYDATVQRVVIHEPVDDVFSEIAGPQSELVTGEYCVPSPMALANTQAALSDCHPVNGSNPLQTVEI